VTTGRKGAQRREKKRSILCDHVMANTEQTGSGSLSSWLAEPTPQQILQVIRRSEDGKSWAAFGGCYFLRMESLKRPFAFQVLIREGRD